MESESAILALAALAQSTRLETFRLLVRHEPDGLPAGEIADALAVPANTMSAHLGVLSRAGLFLLKDCCQGRAELCEPLLAELNPCRT